MTAVLLSVAFAVVSAAAYALAAVAQQRAGASGLPMLRDRRWWVAVGLNGAGGLLHVVALAYGPLSLVQPLGALTLVFALPIGALLQGRSVSRGEWRGAGLTLAGLIGVFAVTTPVGGAGTETLGFAAVATLAAATGAGLFLLSGAARRATGGLRSLLYAIAAGVAFAVASVLTKTFTLDGSWTTAVLVAAFSAAGLVLSQAAYQGSELALPTAVVTLANPVAAAAIGIGLLGEGLNFGGAGIALAAVSAVLACWGTVALLRPASTVPAVREPALV